VVELAHFQAKGVRAIDHFGGVLLLADEMGLGKTIQVLAWLKKHPEQRPAIISAPAHLTHHWKEEAKEKFGLRTAVLSGLNAKPLDMSVTPSILIVSQDVLSTITKKLEGGKKKTYKGWAEVLKAVNPKVVIWDEAHNYKNRQAKRTKSLRKLVHSAPYRIAISGTPLTNRPADLWPTLNMLWPQHFPSFFSFALRYCKAVKLPWGWDYRGASHLGELHNRLKGLGMLRRLKANVLSELPPKRRTVIPIDIPMDEYNRVANDFVNWLQEKGKKATKADKMTQLGYLKRIAAKAKMAAVIEWIDNYLEGTEDKLAIYGIHKDIIRHGLYERYKKIAVLIDGDVPQGSHRQKLVKIFQNDKRKRLFFGNLIAAGTGITIVAAPVLLTVELDWVPANHTQVEDRIHRIGQSKHTEIVYPVARGTIEELLCKIIQTKQKISSTVLDGVSQRTGDIDIFDQLVKQVTEQLKRAKAGSKKK